MGESQGWQCGVLFCKLGEGFDDIRELGQEQVQAVPEDNQVGVVPNESGGSAQVNDGACFGGNVTPGVDVSHHVVSELFLVDRGGFNQ